MLKNNKGVTLVELIICITLISIIMMFLFKLLADIRYNDKNIDFNRDNQLQRAVIMKLVQDDFLDKKLIGLSDTKSTESELVLDFIYQTKPNATLRVSANNISYTNSLGTEKWALPNDNGLAKWNTKCVQFDTSFFSHSDATSFYIKITIPMLMGSKNENTIDDLEFFYIGPKTTGLTFTNMNKPYLGNYSSNNC